MLEEPLAVALELAARAVDGGQQERRGAGRFLQIEAEAQPLAVDSLAADAQDRGLAEAAERLVDAADRQVGPARERGRRQSRMKPVVEAPCVVGDQRQVALVADLRQRADVRADPVVGRREDHRRAGVGMRVEDARQLIRGHAVRELALVVVVGIDPHWVRAAHDQTRDGRLVAVARHHQLLSGPGGGEDRGVDAHRASVGGEERLVGAERVGGELLSRALHLPLPAARVESVRQREVAPVGG